MPWGAEVQHAPETGLWFHFYFYSLESKLSWQMLPFIITLKLIYIKMWMPCFYHIPYQHHSVHFTKLYAYKSIAAKSILKGKHLRELANRKFHKKQQIRGKISSKILQCKFTVTISEKFWLLFQEKQLLTQLKWMSYKKLLNLQSILKKCSDVSSNAFTRTVIPCCQPLNILSDFFNLYSCALDFSYSIEFWKHSTLQVK